MPAVSESQSRQQLTSEDVLTLPEAAAYLRVQEQGIVELLADHAIPGQKIGGEWRFSRRAIDRWLRHEPPAITEMLMPHPFWLLEHPLSEKLLLILEQRLSERLEVVRKPQGERGSKQAVLKHFGIFQEDDDLDERLADAKARREAAAGE